MDTQQSTSDPPQAADLGSIEEGFAAEESTTISKLFKKAVEIFPNRYALRYKENNIWKELTYSQYYKYCCEVAMAYIEVNIAS